MFPFKCLSIWACKLWCAYSWTCKTRFLALTTSILMYLLLSCIIMRWAHSSLPASQMKLFFLLFIFLFLPSQRPYHFLACFLLICFHWTIGLSPLSAGSSLGNIEFRLQERDFSFWQIFHTLLHCLTEKNHLLGSKGFPETSVLAYREPREDEHCRISTNHNPRTEKEASITTNPYMLYCVSQMPIKTK